MSANKVGVNVYVHVHVHYDIIVEVAKQQVCMSVSCMLHTFLKYIHVQRSQHNFCSAHAALQLIYMCVHVYIYSGTSKSCWDEPYTMYMYIELCPTLLWRCIPLSFF